MRLYSANFYVHKVIDPVKYKIDKKGGATVGWVCDSGWAWAFALNEKQHASSCPKIKHASAHFDSTCKPRRTSWILILTPFLILELLALLEPGLHPSEQQDGSMAEAGGSAEA